MRRVLATYDSKEQLCTKGSHCRPAVTCMANRCPHAQARESGDDHDIHQHPSSDALHDSAASLASLPHCGIHRRTHESAASFRLLHYPRLGCFISASLASAATLPIKRSLQFSCPPIEAPNLIMKLPLMCASYKLIRSRWFGSPMPAVWPQAPVKQIMPSARFETRVGSRQQSIDVRCPAPRSLKRNLRFNRTSVQALSLIRRPRRLKQLGTTLMSIHAYNLIRSSFAQPIDARSLVSKPLPRKSRGTVRRSRQSRDKAFSPTQSSPIHALPREQRSQA